MAHLQKHEREFLAVVRSLGVRAVAINKRRGHPRITGVTPDGRPFQLPIPGSPGDRNWMHAARRQVLRILNPRTLEN